MQYCPSPGGVSVLWQRRSLGSGKLPLFLSPPLRVCALVPGAQLGAPLCSPGAHSFAAQPSPLPPPPCSSYFLQPAAAMADSASESDTDGAGGNSSSSAAMQSSCSSTSGGGGGGGGGGVGGGGGKSGGIVISPFRLEELTNRLASLQQENKVLKIELETYKLKCKALQEENRDLRKASVTIVSAPGGAPQRRPPPAPGRGCTLTRAAPGFPEAPGDPQRAHSLPRPAGLRRVGERMVSLRGRAGLSFLGVRAPHRVREKALGQPPTFPFHLYRGSPSRSKLEAGGVAGGRGGTSSVLACLRGASTIWRALGWGRGRKMGPVPGAWLEVRGVRSWAGHFAGISTALAGSPREEAGESGWESGKWSFLARIEREGRVPELMLLPPLVVLSLVERVEVGGGGGGIQPGECRNLHWPVQSEGYETWTG